MTIAVVQSNHGPGAGGSTWPAAFSGNTTPGNTLFLAVFAYNSGAVISSNSPTYNGSAYPAASLLESQCSTDSGNVYCGIWMYPAVGTAATALSATCVNGTVDGNVGWVCYEVSGLGSSPVMDQGTGANGNTGTVSSGTTGAITTSPEFIIGAADAYGIDMTAASGFTNLWNGSGSGFCEAGYQIAVSSGGTYAYATTPGMGADWSAVIATVRAAAVPAGPAYTAFSAAM